jgi:hypothetical protein
LALRPCRCLEMLEPIVDSEHCSIKIICWFVFFHLHLTVDPPMEGGKEHSYHKKKWVRWIKGRW